MRKTHTDLESEDESKIDDFWMDARDKELTDSWTGMTVFELLRPEPPAHHKWVEGRLTRIKKGARPDNVWPEVWRTLSHKGQLQAIKEWEITSEVREKARLKRGRRCIPADEVDDYNRQLSDVREYLSCLLYTSPSPRDRSLSRMPSSA